MKRTRSLLALLLCLSLLMPLAGTAEAAYTPFALKVRVEGVRETSVRAYDEAYPGNLYLSLSDLSQALAGTAKQFRIDYLSATDSFAVATGKAPGAAAVNPATRARGESAYLEITRPRIYLNGSERRYYCYRNANSDLYLNLTDVQLLLDLEAELLPDGTLALYPDWPFSPNPERLKQEGYFDAINAVVLGDADTGEILFSSSPFLAFPIASLSKLMTYLLVREAAWEGKLSFSDAVPITAEAARIAGTEDGTIGVSVGMSVPLRELVDVMLLRSSNEAADSLAAYTAGTSEAFVDQMNRRARELSLYSARFYTPHGLPVFSKAALSAKLQNKMSAMDMFELCAYLLKNDPELVKISSKTYAEMPTLKYNTFNTNPFLINVPGVNGLKTGSTNRAGYCVTVSLPITRGETTHTIVLVVLGAETPDLRGQAGEILLRYAQRYYAEHDFRE